MCSLFLFFHTAERFTGSIHQSGSLVISTPTPIFNVQTSKHVFYGFKSFYIWIHFLISIQPEKIIETSGFYIPEVSNLFFFWFLIHAAFQPDLGKPLEPVARKGNWSHFSMRQRYPQMLKAQTVRNSEVKVPDNFSANGWLGQSLIILL